MRASRISVISSSVRPRTNVPLCGDISIQPSLCSRVKAVHRRTAAAEFFRDPHLGQLVARLVNELGDAPLDLAVDNAGAVVGIGE